MEVPLTPLDFARRARALYADREAVVDGNLRLTYDAVLRSLRSMVGGAAALGVKAGDRVAYIAPNTHAQLESFYAVPQIGRRPGAHQLPADRRRLRLHHHAQRRDGRLRARGLSRGRRQNPRATCRHVRHFVALEGAREGWLDYETLVTGASPVFARAADRGSGSADDQLHERHDVASEGRDDHAS